jgi:hypothetical protein
MHRPNLRGVWAGGDDGTSGLEIVNTVEIVLSNVTSDGYTWAGVETLGQP